MKTTYRIHPTIGVARVGNSGIIATGLAPGTAASGEFYLGPERTGGLPIECDPFGNPILHNGQVQHVTRYKDAAGAIKRQAARFKVLAHDDESGESRDPGKRDHRHPLDGAHRPTRRRSGTTSPSS